MALGLGDERGVLRRSGLLQQVAPVRRVGHGQRVVGDDRRDLGSVRLGSQVGPEQAVHQRVDDGEVVRLIPVVEQVDVLQPMEVFRTGPRMFFQMEAGMGQVHDQLGVRGHARDEGQRRHGEAVKPHGQSRGDPARDHPRQGQARLRGDVAGVAFVEAADRVDHHVVEPVEHLVAAHHAGAPRQPTDVLEKTVVRVAERFHQEHAAQSHRQRLQSPRDQRGRDAGGDQAREQPSGERFRPGQSDQADQAGRGVNLEQLPAQGMVRPAQKGVPKALVE